MSDPKEKLECGDTLGNGDTYICEQDTCQVCCPHDEFEHYECLICGYEKCPGEDIDAAEYYIDTER